MKLNVETGIKGMMLSLYKNKVQTVQIQPLSQRYSLLWQFSTKLQASKQFSYTINTVSCLLINQTKLPQMDVGVSDKIYTDDCFPPNNYSYDRRQNYKVHWNVPKKYVLIGDSPLKGLAVYGALSVLRSLGKHWLQFLLPRKQNKKGDYAVRLFLNGVWRYVRVDPHYPITKSGKPLCTVSQSANAQLWSTLIEKAYVKSYSDYLFYYQATPKLGDVLNEITGLPNREYTVDEIKKKWRKLNQEFIVTFINKDVQIPTLHRATQITESGVTSQKQFFQWKSIDRFIVANYWERSYHTSIQATQSIAMFKLQVGDQFIIEICQHDCRMFPKKIYNSIKVVGFQQQSGKLAMAESSMQKRTTLAFSNQKQTKSTFTIYVFAQRSANKTPVQLCVYSKQKHIVLKEKNIKFIQKMINFGTNRIQINQTIKMGFVREQNKTDKLVKKRIILQENQLQISLCDPNLKEVELSIEPNSISILAFHLKIDKDAAFWKKKLQKLISA